MLCSLAIRSLQISKSSMPRGVVARGMAASLGDKIKSKEHVEEERYIREREKVFFEKMKAQKEQKMLEAEEKMFREQIAPAMAEAESALKKTGDSVSDAGLEALARWKVGL